MAQLAPELRYFGLSYASRIRNRAKREYAERYSAWIAHGSQGDAPDRGSLGAMGAQAVRLELAELWTQAVDEFLADQWRRDTSRELCGEYEPPGTSRDFPSGL